MSVDDPTSTADASASTVNADNPWPGLLAFREADQGYFQGRKRETEELSRLILRERLVVLFGLSGLGKSSLLQAGVFPSLRERDILPVYIRLDFSAPSPDLIGQVESAIARAAAHSQVEAPAARAGETIWEYLHRVDNDFWTPRNRPAMPLLVFDQFEEIFTLGRRDASRAEAAEALLEQLSDVSEGRPPARLRARLDENPKEALAFHFSRHHYKVLLSLRSDFLADLETLRPRMPALALNRFQLQRMDGEAALLVVNQAAHLIDPDVGERVVRFVGAGQSNQPLAELTVEPALLSVVCRELNRRRREAGEAKITAGLLEGSDEQVLADFYEQTVGDLPPGTRRFVEDHLLTVSGYRDSVAVDNALSEPGVTRESIDALVERRLVRREDRGGVERLELTHDLLCEVVRGSRDRRLDIEAREREIQSLKQAQAEQSERELKAFKEKQKEAELKRTRIAVGVSFLLFLLACGGAIWAMLSRGEAVAARKDAVVKGREAREQAQNAKEAYERIQQSILIRQAALAGDDAKLTALFAKVDRDSQIQFEVRAKNLGYRNPSNQQVYEFSMYPNPDTLPKGDDAVAFITYLANHRTFRNTLMTTGESRGFHGSYVGWGCLTRIVALIEFKDPTRAPAISEFNMCTLAGW